MPKEGVVGVIKDSDNPIDKVKSLLPYHYLDGFTSHQRCIPSFFKNQPQCSLSLIIWKIDLN